MWPQECSLVAKKVASFQNCFFTQLWLFISQEKHPKSVKVHTALMEDDEEEVGTGDIWNRERRLSPYR